MVLEADVPFGGPVCLLIIDDLFTVEPHLDVLPLRRNLRVVPLLPTSTPSSTLHFPPCIGAHPFRSRPLNSALLPSFDTDAQATSPKIIKLRSSRVFMARVLRTDDALWPARS